MLQQNAPFYMFAEILDTCPLSPYITNQVPVKYRQQGSSGAYAKLVLLFICSGQKSTSVISVANRKLFISYTVVYKTILHKNSHLPSGHMVNKKK